MNEQWSGFDETDDKSPLGLTIHMAPMPDDFFAGVFCSTWTPPSGQKTGCFKGNAYCDCRFSTALYNKKMIVTDKGLPKLMGKSVGVVLNQGKVEANWTKCSYVSDGGSSDRYHNGCGQHAAAADHDCSSKHSAFANICPSTGETCTPDAVEVASNVAEPYGKATPAHLYTLPDVAWTFTGQDDWTLSPSHLRDMVKLRLSTPSIVKGAWNEVVLDERLFLPDLAQFPSDVIVAIIYPKSVTNAKLVADKMAENIPKAFGQSLRIPVVMANDVDGNKVAPFEAVGEQELVI
jgi:hypothetical protein